MRECLQDSPTLAGFMPMISPRLSRRRAVCRRTAITRSGSMMSETSIQKGLTLLPRGGKPLQEHVRVGYVGQGTRLNVMVGATGSFGYRRYL